jgi:glycosyltransferase involved in cell wall biosynthesis
MAVTVWIPCRNMAATVGKAVMSAVTEGAAEVVVFDDASTDGSVQVVEQIAADHPQVRLVAYETKSDDWQAAAARHFHSFIGTHIIGLGADDELLYGMVSCEDLYRDAPVVFADYHVRLPSGDPYGSVVHGFKEQTALQPHEVVERIHSDCNATETGIGSALQRDSLEWLCELEWWRMGPFSDCFGYSAVAARAGALYLPGAGAVFTQDPNGYGEKMRTSPDVARYANESYAFLRRAGLDQSTAERLLRKRGIVDGR